jgi:hypothetical protein
MSASTPHQYTANRKRDYDRVKIGAYDDMRRRTGSRRVVR